MSDEVIAEFGIVGPETIVAAIESLRDESAELLQRDGIESPTGRKPDCS